MADMDEFLFELARQIKRHPQSYPVWMSVLADDVVEARGNVAARKSAAVVDSDDGRMAEAARRFLES